MKSLWAPASFKREATNSICNIGFGHNPDGFFGEHGTESGWQHNSRISGALHDNNRVGLNCCCYQARVHRLMFNIFTRGGNDVVVEFDRLSFVVGEWQFVELLNK